ncbi:MAG: hypothetical protein WC378_15610 [Opitutaceae bacterium]|jgi:hypothetical protein
MPILLCLLLAGCVTEPDQPPVASPDVTSLATLAEAAARATVQAEHERAIAQTQRAKVAADLETAAKANQGNPDGPPKATTGDAIKMAKANNGHAQADPAQLLIGEKIARANAEGRASEAAATRDAAIGEAASAAAELAAVQSEADASRSDLSAKITAKDAELAKQKTASEESIKRIQAAHVAALAKIKAENTRSQQEWLNRFGVTFAALAVIAVLAGFFIGAAGRFLLASGVFALASPMCFGLSQIVGEPWFRWAVLGCIAVVVLIFLAVSWAHSERKEQAAIAETLVPTLDEAKAAATPEQQAVLQDTIFSRLSDAKTGMRPKVKASVHRIRANIKAKSKP